MVIVFGDTHTSLAGALAATYQQIPVAHIEAGLRSFNRNMPEEINRILIDRIAKIKLCPNNYAVSNLHAEGVKDDIYVVGDPMFDAMIKFIPIKKTKNFRQYILVTVHRNFNADNKEALVNIFEALAECSDERYILPVHPRTEKNLKEFGIKIPKNVKMVKPQTYKQMLSLISNAKKVVTDSGGVQREAYWMNVPVIMLRTETEWLEIPAKGAGMLVGENKKELVRAIKEFKGSMNPPPDPGANKKIRDVIYRYT